MSGLDSEQLDELVQRIEDQLEEPWHKEIGRRPKDLSLREAVVVACGYMRQNIIQEIWAEIFDTSQPVISPGSELGRPSGPWEYKVSKTKLAEALWPMLERKIEAAMADEDAEVPPIVEVVVAAFRTAQNWRYKSFVLTAAE
jgi:hypothetical protein